MNWKVILKPEDLAAIAQEEISRILNELGLGWTLSALMQALLGHEPAWRTRAKRRQISYIFSDLTLTSIIADGRLIGIEDIFVEFWQLVFAAETTAGWEKVSVVKQLLEKVGIAAVLSAIAEWVSDPEHQLAHGVTVDEGPRWAVTRNLEHARDRANRVFPRR